MDALGQEEKTLPTSIGSYRVIKKLGAGGMGVVYLADDLLLKRKVALKTLLDTGTLEARDRILREAQAAARLNHHPNVAAVYHVERAGADIHIVMEYVKGETLAARLRHGPLPAETAVTFAIQLADALSEAHDMGVLHRDLKPGNVIVNPKGVVKVLDFGLARTHSVRKSGFDPEPDSQERSSEEQEVVGTPGYIPPEAFRGHLVDERGDIWSFGVTLYEMLTGRRAFPGNDMEGSGPMARDRAPPRVRASSPDVSESLDAIVARAMARDPADRYRSAAEVGVALRSAHEAFTAASSRTLVSRRERIRRSPRLQLLGAVAVATAVVGYGVVQLSMRPADAARASAVVAVLPLANITGEPTADVVGAGFADILISTLAQIPGVTMISRDATLDFRQPKRDATRIARELGADLVVDGAVQISQESVRVTLSLLRPGSNRVAWSRSYDGDLGSIFTLQSDVALATSQALQLTLSPEDRRRLRSPPSTNVEALADYAQARSFLERPEVETHLERSITLFESAIARDPRFARAHAGLGEASWKLYQRNLDPAWSEKALLATTESLRLDPEDASVHRALAVLHKGHGRTEEAIGELRRAIALEPENDEGHRALGEILLDQSRRPEGLAELRAAIALRPNYWRHHNTLGRALFLEGRNAEAAEAYRRVTELQPDNPLGFSGLGMVSYAMGNTDRAIECFERAIALGDDSSSHTNLGLVLYAQGRYAEAARAFGQAARLSPMEPAKHRNLGDAYERTGQREQAKQAYERAAELCREKLRINPRDGHTLAQLAVYEAKLGSDEDAARHAEEAVGLIPGDSVVLYRRAVVLALAERPNESLIALEQAFEHGYSHKLATEDEDLGVLHGRPEFESLTGAATRGPGERG